MYGDKEKNRKFFAAQLLNKSKLENECLPHEKEEPENQTKLDNCLEPIEFELEDRDQGAYPVIAKVIVYCPETSVPEL